MKIIMFSPPEEFSKEQQEKLNTLGTVNFVPERKEYNMAELVEMCKDADILGFDPDPVGGFEKSHEKLTELAQNMPKLKGVALGTTAFEYVNKTYFKGRNIPVTNVPHYSRESVAEHAFAMLLGAAKRILVTDRKTQQGSYKLRMGMELQGKTLGVIGLGSIGSRVAQIGVAFGMKVIAYNRTPKKIRGVTMVSINALLKNADAISIHLSSNNKTDDFLSAKRISLLKKGVIIVNTADTALVNEEAISNALKRNVVDTYVLEVDDVTKGPLAKLDNAILLRGFGWYTKEALYRNKEIWIQNIERIVQGNPLNLIN